MALRDKLFTKAFWGWYIIYAVAAFMIGPDQQETRREAIDAGHFNAYDNVVEVGGDWGQWANWFEWDYFNPALLSFVLPILPLFLLFAYWLITSKN